jgi:hypothetical protein
MAPRPGRFAGSLLAVLLAGALLAGCGGESDGGAALLRRLPDGVAFPAVVQSSSFDRKLLGFGMPGYHLIVWDDGWSVSMALFRARVSDIVVLDALEALGARPGNNLGRDAWSERKNPASPAADAVISGPPVNVEIVVPGRSQPLSLTELLSDSAGRGFEMHLGGHRANAAKWHSGCVVCLYSCPGSKVGNARYTLRDYARETTAFRLRPGVLPADGTEVEIRLRLAS